MRFPDNEILKTRARYEIWRAAMERERGTFLYHYKDLGRFILPRRPRFFVTDVDKGDYRNQNIQNNCATLAADKLAVGMMSYNTNPASVWFQLLPTDPSLQDSEAVKEWCEEVREILSLIFLQGNFYDSTLTVYKDLGVFGTSCMSIVEDFETTIHTEVFPVWSYMLGNDHKHRVRKVCRNFMMTVYDVVDKFAERDDRTGEIDWSNISSRVKGLWDNDQHDAWVEITHIIAPNDHYDGQRPESRFKRFRSTYYERGVVTASGSPIPGSASEPKFLEDKGFDYFPVVAPRWEVTGEDIYATNCPGMTALGDIKQLQVGERRGLQAVEKGINPPLVGPSELKNQRVSLLPGDVTFLDQAAEKASLRPIHEVNWNIDSLENKQRQCEKRIEDAFFIPILQTFIDRGEDDGEGKQPITAAEVAERKSEKLVALGNVVWRIQREFLQPAIEATFEIAMRQGRLPKPPPELAQVAAAGLPLKIEYTSILAQAQKALALGGIDRFNGFVQGLAEIKPDALDMVDFDKAVEEYADKTGIPPRILVPEDQVAQIRQQRQQQQAMQQKIAAMEQASKAAKNLGQTPTDPSQPNALQDLISQASVGAAGQAMPAGAA